mgnify:CR=1 FL=1
MNGTEGLIYYNVLHAPLTVDNLMRSLRAMVFMLEHDKRSVDGPVEVWVKDDAFMVCTVFDGDSRHLAKEGWTRRV